jgi:membrane protease YdiL (CAAX protease family)
VLGGLAFGLVATLPMGLALPLVRSGGPDLGSILGTVLLGPFAEEVLFRGFMLAFLVRRAGWSVPVAIYATSLAFGLAHMDRTLLSVLLVSAGGALFGWVYYRWGNLWHAIGLHACINLWWELTSGSAAFDTGADTFPLSVAHALSAGLAILLTLKGTREERESAREAIQES